MAIDVHKRISTAEVQQKKEGTFAIVAGWAEDIKVLGKIAFIKLRDREGYLQLVTSDKKLIKEIEKLTRDSVILAQGKIKKSELKAGGNELQISVLEVLSKAQPKLPIDITGKIPTDLSKRLDWRFLDLRNPKHSAIFEVQSEICRAFREFFRKQGFTEIWPPEIIASASEGGAELFSLEYMGKKAFLAQSPQLYKQILTVTNLERVFSIAPVWRAEPSDTYKHLNEIRQMDMEMAFADQMSAIDYLDKVVKHIVKSVKQNCKKQLELLGRKLEIPKTKTFSYTEIIKILKKKGFKIEWGDDIGTEAERKLAEIFGDQTLIHIHSWPAKEKPFYIMPNAKNPKLSEGFDTDYGGIEIASGGQRIHIPELLIKQIKAKGLDPAHFKSYIDSFRYGAPPHAGWSIGLERLTMSILGLKNIREACLFPRDRVRLTP